MTRSVHRWCAGFVALVCAPACTYDFDAPFAGAGGGDTSSASSASGDGGAASGGGASTGTTSSTTSTTSSTTSTTSSGPATVTVDCDGACTFVPGDGGCCWDETLNHGAPQAECLTSAPQGNDCRTQGSTQGLETLIGCQHPEDCDAGQLCCAVWDVANDGTEYFPSVQCRSACAAPSVSLCDPDGEACAPGLDCLPLDGLPDGYAGCQP